MALQKKPKVLIIDDTAENIDVLVALLESSYQIAAAKGGQKGLDIALKLLPDLILLDAKMPDMDGYQVCHSLKSCEATKKIPVIFVTSLSHVIDETQAFSIGAVDFITKPFNASVVKARVKTHINLKLQSDMLEQLISIDSLTQIGNRKKLDEVLAIEWKRAYRSRGTLSVVIIDIDYFKEYNDNYGHAHGDECLKQVAQALRQALPRPGDFVGRYGGDEFVAVLTDTDQSGTRKAVEHMRESVAALNIPHAFSAAASQVTLSMGAATAIPYLDKIDLAGLLEAADSMLYESKGKGRDKSSYTEA